MFARQLHVVLMLDTAVSSILATEADRMASRSGRVAAAEARKAEGASMHTLLTPKSPHVNRQRRLFQMCIRKLDFKNNSMLQKKMIIIARSGPQDIILLLLLYILYIYIYLFCCCYFFPRRIEEGPYDFGFTFRQLWFLPDWIRLI